MTRPPAWLGSRGWKLCYYGRLEYDVLVFCASLPTFLLFSLRIPVCTQQYLLRVLLAYPGKFTAVSSSCSFVCAAVVICYYSHQVRIHSNVKATTTTTTTNNTSSQVRNTSQQNNISPQVRNTYVTKGTYVRYM